MSRDEAMTDERLDSLERWRSEVDEKWNAAFPNGDHIGHGRYHQLMIERNAELRRLRAAILEKSIAGLAWGAMVFLALACWSYVKSLIRG